MSGNQALSAYRLVEQKVERVWGRTDLPGQMRGGPPIGEIWFPDGDGGQPELLVKYLFTSARLSVQVHPGNAAARADGYPRGKDEAWLVLGAEPGAVIGLGLKDEVSPEALRSAALDGSVEHLLDWKPVTAGDFFYSPAGTIHAIGAGLSLIEIQQNLDLTYRLYDYGRPRELHLDRALAVAERGPYHGSPDPRELSPGRTVLAEGGAFVVERWAFEGKAIVFAEDGEVQVIPLASAGSLDGQPLESGSVWRLSGKTVLEAAPGIDLLVAYPGATVRGDVVCGIT